MKHECHHCGKRITGLFPGVGDKLDLEMSTGKKLMCEECVGKVDA
jgi:hypothetical protein